MTQNALEEGEFSEKEIDAADEVSDGDNDGVESEEEQVDDIAKSVDDEMKSVPEENSRMDTTSTGDNENENIGTQVESQSVGPTSVSLLPNGDLSFLQGKSDELTKRQRSNAKAVEVLDMSGNSIAQYRSGLEAMKALGVSQGDISLCCRGLKVSCGGYKFRFVDEGARIMAKLKRGYTYEEVGGEEVLRKPDRSEVTRTTRASRGEYGASTTGERSGPDGKPKSALLAPSEMKSRKWRRVLVKIGNLVIARWIPDQEKPTAVLQDHKAKYLRDITKKRKRLSKIVDAGGRQSFTSHEVLGELEE